MIFNTWEFAFFGVATYLIYTFGCPPRARPYVLMLAGLIFYAASIPAYLILILTLAAVSFADGRALLALPRERTGARRWVLAAGVVTIVGVLVFFQYSKLFASTFDGVCRGGCTHFLPDIIVPLAISFFTFEFVHVLVDVYLGKVTSLRVRDFALFTLFFPTMVAGPIKRYQNFVPQIDLARTFEPLVFAAGTYRILMGLAKKVVIADSMTPLVAPLLTPGPAYGPADYWIGVLAYTIKIYFDFSGYSDIAIGIASLLGYDILENFDRPYRARNISQFWRRWHISLSSWIRDYLFIPLGGSHRPGFTLLNLAVVMAISGLWHGAAWHFVLWGLWHGIGMAIHRVWGQRVVPLVPALAHGRLAHAASVAVTFSFVALGWIFFASPTIATAITVFANLIGLGRSPAG
jgi:alginate O-acetyltransferase complex protein AlgI